MNAVLAYRRTIYFRFGTTLESFADLATRNFTILFFLAGILTGSPVTGLRPLRATRTKRPTPSIANTPDFSERSAISDSTKASRLETPSLLAVSRTEGNGVVILAGRAMLFLLCTAAATAGWCMFDRPGAGQLAT
jgi:hypothetical protein